MAGQSSSKETETPQHTLSCLLPARFATHPAHRRKQAKVSNGLVSAAAVRFGDLPHRVHCSRN